MIDESLEQIDESSIFEIGGHRVYQNPTWGAMKRLLRKPGSRMRFSIDKKTGDVYVWDAMDMTHSQFKGYSGFDLLDMELTNNRGGATISFNGRDYKITVDYSPARFLIDMLPKVNKRVKKWTEQLEISK